MGTGSDPIPSLSTTSLDRGRGIECYDRVVGQVEGRHVEGLKHHLCCLLTSLLSKEGSVMQMLTGFLSHSLKRYFQSFPCHPPILKRFSVHVQSGVVQLQGLTEQGFSPTNTIFLIALGKAMLNLGAPQQN